MKRTLRARARFVALTLGKELRETLRDRKTLAVMVLVPLVLYPLLAVLGGQVVSERKRSQEERASLVAVVGGGDTAAATELKRRIDAQPKVFARRDLAANADVAMVEAKLRANELDAVAVLGAAKDGGRIPAEVVLDATRDQGRKAEERLSRELEAMWPPGQAPIFTVDRRDVAGKQQLGGYLLSQVLPIMILIMVVLGAFYPAIDVTAGERERGTLETVLVAPIPRRELLLGKVLAVTLLASLSGLLNLGSMSVTMVHVVNLASPDTDLPIPIGRAAATGLVILPTAFLLASLFVAIGSLARGFKEAQNLLMPVYVLFFAPALLGSMGDLTLTTGLAFVPGLNVSLLARDIALGKAGLGMTATVLLATLGWGLLALAWAARLYVSERFLAATDEGEKRKPAFGLRLDRVDPPTPFEAFVMAMLGFALSIYLWAPLIQKDLVRGLLASQWGGMAGAALLFALVTRRQPIAAFAVKMPPVHALAGAVLMGLGGWMIANVVTQWLFPPPPEMAEQFRRLLFPEQGGRGLAANLFLFALTPAICEELFFRGLIQRALLANKVRPATAILVASVVFAAFHLDVHRLIPTGLVGAMLGFVAWRAGSFVASACSHFINNGILIALGTWGLDKRIDGLTGGAQAGLLAGAVVLVVAGIMTILRTPPDPGAGVAPAA